MTEPKILLHHEIIAEQEETRFSNRGLLISPGRAGVLCAPAGGYKSWHDMGLAQSAAMGEPFFGKFAWEPDQRVLWCDYEQGERMSRHRFQALWRGAQGTGTLGNRLRYAFRPIRHWRMSELSALCLLVQNVTLCCVDSLFACNPGVEENSSAAAEPLELAATASERTGCAFRFTDHQSLKGTGSGLTSQRGHSSKLGASGALYTCTRNRGQVTVECSRGQDAPESAWPAPYTFELQPAFGGQLLALVTPPVKSASDGIADVLESIRDNPERGTHWHAANVHRRPESVTAAIQSLQSAHAVSRGKKGWVIGHRLSLVPPSP